MLLTGLLCFLKCTIFQKAQCSSFWIALLLIDGERTSESLNGLNQSGRPMYQLEFWRIFQPSRAKCSSYNISENNLLALEIKLLSTVSISLESTRQSFLAGEIRLLLFDANGASQVAAKCTGDSWDSWSGSQVHWKPQLSPMHPLPQLSNSLACLLLIILPYYLRGLHNKCDDTFSLAPSTLLAPQGALVGLDF